MLVIAGLMVRRLYLGPSISADLVGPGDIIRPWEDELLPGFTPGLSEWRVVEEATVALLDERITRAMGRWPEFSTMISARFIRRARSLAYLMAAHGFTKVQDRLLAALWHLAAMWGKVTPTGIRVPFRLTHEMLAEIVGARRPSVTVALRALERQERIARDDHRCYLVCGDPPDWTTTRPPLAERETQSPRPRLIGPRDHLTVENRDRLHR